MYLGLAVIVGFSLFPIYWIVISALRSSQKLLQYPPLLFPSSLTFNNFVQLMTKTHFPYFLRNSSLVCVSAILITISIATFGAYGLTRFRFPGRNSWAVTTLFVYMVPPVLLIIPFYVFMAKLHLSNTLISLVIVYVARALPFSLWLLWAFFRSIPIELEEAAFVDGASRLTVMFRIFLPVTFPGIVATATFAFATTWNDYIFALVLISSTRKMTIPVGLGHFISEYEILWTYIFAGGTIAIIPVVIFFLLFQRYLIRGWGAGAVKG